MKPFWRILVWSKCFLWELGTTFLFEMLHMAYVCPVVVVPLPSYDACYVCRPAHHARATSPLGKDNPASNASRGLQFDYVLTVWCGFWGACNPTSFLKKGYGLAKLDSSENLWNLLWELNLFLKCFPAASWSFTMQRSFPFHF